MPCIHGSCTSASSCTHHAALALAASDSAAAADDATARIAALAGELRVLRSGSPRRELLDCGRLLAERYVVDPEAPGAWHVATVLEQRRGAPLALGAIAVTAARDAGIALGLLAGPRGQLAVAHATFDQPLVLDVGGGFALTDLAGDECLFRWLCAHETARRVAAALARDTHTPALA